MSQFHGPQPEGAMRLRREVKRAEAEARNANTAPERRRRNRLASQGKRKGSQR